MRDLDTIAKKLLLSQNQTNLILRLRPIPDYVRSTAFLEKVSTLVGKHGIPVELEGSILSHAYYVFRVQELEFGL